MRLLPARLGHTSREIFFHEALFSKKK